MERIEFNCISDFTDSINEVFEEVCKKDSDADISIIAKYTEANQIIKDLISKYDFNIYSIYLCNDDSDGYYDEYIISLANPSGINELFCEQFKRENGYRHDKSTITYVMDNCSSACLKKIESNSTLEVAISSEDTNSDMSLDTSTGESTYISRDKNGVPVGFQKSWSDSKNGVNYYSSYSFFSDDTDELKRMAGNFEICL